MLDTRPRPLPQAATPMSNKPTSCKKQKIHFKEFSLVRWLTPEFPATTAQQSSRLACASYVVRPCLSQEFLAITTGCVLNRLAI